MYRYKKIAKTLFAGLLITMASIQEEFCSFNVGDKKLDYHKVINKYYPGFVLMDFENLASYYRSYYKDKPPKENLFLIKNDFDGNGLSDYAFVLRSENEKKAIFSILMQITRGEYIKAIYLDIGAHYDDVVIEQIDAGSVVEQSAALPGERIKATVKYPSVMLSFLEVSSKVYFWDQRKKQFDVIWTSD